MRPRGTEASVILSLSYTLGHTHTRPGTVCAEPRNRTVGMARGGVRAHRTVPTVKKKKKKTETTEDDTNKIRQCSWGDEDVDHSGP